MADLGCQTLWNDPSLCSLPMYNPVPLYLSLSHTWLRVFSSFLVRKELEANVLYHYIIYIISYHIISVVGRVNLELNNAMLFQSCRFCCFPSLPFVVCIHSPLYNSSGYLGYQVDSAKPLKSRSDILTSEQWPFTEVGLTWFFWFCYISRPSSSVLRTS